MTQPDLWPQPLEDPDSAGFWQAARNGTFAVCRCRDCLLWMQPPLERCRACGGATAFEEASGRGRLHSWVVANRASVPGPEVPYVIGVVEIEEQPGVRFSGLVLDEGPAELRVGAPVTVVLRAVPGGSFFAPCLVIESVS